MDYDYSPIKKQICVLIGAGMSAGAGIPTFRGKNGEWTTERRIREAFEIDNYLRDADLRHDLWQWLVKSPAWTAKPTRAHWSLKRLDDAGHLRAIMTQNFDMLEKKAGIRQGKIRQLHGRLDKTVCLSCHQYFDTKDIIEQATVNQHCPACGGLLKPDIVFFGEPLDEMMLKMIYGMDIPACDEIWCVGSSLQVYPAADIPMEAKRLGKKVIIVSTDATALDDIADQIIRLPADIALSQLVECTIHDATTDRIHL